MCTCKCFVIIYTDHDYYTQVVLQYLSGVMENMLTQLRLPVLEHLTTSQSTKGLMLPGGVNRFTPVSTGINYNWKFMLMAEDHVQELMSLSMYCS